MTAASLRSHTWLSRYRTGRNDVVAEFYVPAYESARIYCRASGYFTSSSLTLIGRGLETFVERGGVVRLIASPQLEDDDIADIERGYELRDVFERATMRVLEGSHSEIVLDGLGTIGRLIAQGQLDIKLAFVNSRHGFGIYHEKIGYFRDDAEDVIAFTGSSNETYGGLFANFESIDVYQSWVTGDAARVTGIVDDFDDLWFDRTPELEVTAFPEVARAKLVSIARDRPAPTSLPGTDDAWLEENPTDRPGGMLRVPPSIEARDYQREAIQMWLRNRGRGILKMATGTGKTKTALMAASHIARVEARREQALVVVIVAPFQHLVDQWMEELKSFGTTPIGVYESSRKWVPVVSDAFDAIRLGGSSGVVLVTTNASLALDVFQDLLGRVNAPLLFIGDEVHNLGSERMARLLPINAAYRMGLSATPERYMDDAGTQRLIDYFGPVVFEIDLAQAIAMGALCHYNYFPRPVELDDEEMDAYSTLSAQIAALLGSGEGLDDAAADSPLGQLLRKRSAILGHAAGKLPEFAVDLERHRRDWFQLVYCAEGNRPEFDGGVGSTSNQVSDALELIGSTMGLSAHEYVSDTPRRERRALLRRFASGDDLRVLVAMRCLDEGVDIPDARVAYLLASSSNPRQFIQRRGRLLRQVPGEEKVATIYDYLAIPQQKAVEAIPDSERSLVRRELERSMEFAEQADNYAECLAMLRPVKERYGLMDL